MAFAVSVITPTRYRTEELLRAVRSVQSQAVDGEVEHVVVGDDHPRLGRLRQAIAAIAPRARVVNLPSPAAGTRDHEVRDYPPARTGRARNRGVALASAPLIAHLDDDNEYAEGHLASLAELLAEDPGAAGAHSARLLLNRDGTPYLEPRYPWMASSDGLGPTVYDALARHGVFTRGSNVVCDAMVGIGGEPLLTVDTSELMIRSRVQRRFLFCERYQLRSVIQRHTEDYDLMRRLHSAGIRLRATGSPTLRYYLGGYSNSQ